MLSEGPSWRDTWPERVALGLLAVLLLAGAGWFGATWVDPSGTDTTCGGLYRTDLWLQGSEVCSRVMFPRLGVFLVLVGIAGGLVYLAVRQPRPRA